MTVALSLDLAAAQDDLLAFSHLIGHPLTDVQAQALSLETRTTVIVAPRQTGKSESLAVLALWWAYRTPGQLVLVVSAGEDASRRLLASIRAMAVHPLLAGSVVDEGTALVVLSNGSEVRSVPASERAIRGWSTDLLLVDEAALLTDDLLDGAAIPTTAARPQARIVMASTPWATQGSFYRHALAGLQASPFVRTVRWTLADAPWVTPAVIEHARSTMTELRYRAEYEAEFMAGGLGYFDPADLLASTADYHLCPPAEALGETVVAGLDWGKRFDRHAIVTLGMLDDHGRNESPVLFIPFLETSQRPYTEQVATVVDMAEVPGTVSNRRRWYGVRRDRWERHDGPYAYAEPEIQPLPNGGYLYEDSKAYYRALRARAQARPGYRLVRVLSEENGVGAMPTEELRARLAGRVTVEGVHTSQRSKEDAYGRVKALLGHRRLVLPADVELLRQLRGMAYEPTPSGGLSIAAANPNVHDDVADALSLAAAALPLDMDAGQPSAEPPEVEWLATSAGVSVPSRPRPRRAALGSHGSKVYRW